jgi:tetratricopeptide (TPR) repeat protein
MANAKSKGKRAAASKKPAAKPRRPAPAHGTGKPVRAAKQAASKPVKFPVRKPTADEIAHKLALDKFTSGLELMNQGQFARARTIFEKLTDHPAREIGERSRVYLNICRQRLARPAVNLKSIDELYDYAVSLANEGQPEQAEEHLRKALKINPNADFLYYALAATFALRNDVEGTLEYLDKAIQMNSRNRYQAQNDPDFENMFEDPRFTELIYPERPLG